MECQRHELVAYALKRLASEFTGTQEVYCAVLYYLNRTQSRIDVDKKPKKHA